MTIISPPKALNDSGHQLGFTLIEVMIVVAIMGILTAIALPSYRESVLRGNRAAARAGLLESQQFMERFYATNDSYSTDKAGGAVALPARFSAVPADSPKYVIALGSALSASATALTSNAYALEATPNSTDDKCAVLWLTNTGVKGTSGTGTVAECWK